MLIFFEYMLNGIKYVKIEKYMLEWKKIYYFRKNYVKFGGKCVKFKQKYVILGKNMLK